MPRFNNETRKKRIKELMRMLEKGLEVAKRDFDIAVGKDFAKLYKQRWAEQQELRKVSKARTEAEKQALGWKTKRDIHIEAYKQAIADSSKNLASELRKMQDQAGIRQFRIYMDTLIKAEKDSYTKEQAKSMANNALTRAGLRRMDGAIVGTVGLRQRDREIRRLEEEIKAHIRKNMTAEEKGQADLLEEYEKSNRKNRR
jgi:hypothetical protein